jgi:hypothetical protein
VSREAAWKEFARAVVSANAVLIPPKLRPESEPRLLRMEDKLEWEEDGEVDTVPAGVEATELEVL